jgi:uncharacterized protein involved in tolerance to divalent cations
MCGAVLRHPFAVCVNMYDLRDSVYSLNSIIHLTDEVLC